MSEDFKFTESLVESQRLITEDRANEAIQNVLSHISDIGSVSITVISHWTGSIRWGRNVASLSSDSRDVVVQIARRLHPTAGGRGGLATTNQLDPASLKGATELAEHYAYETTRPQGLDLDLERPNHRSVEGEVWSDTTFNRTVTDNAALIRDITTGSKKEGLLSAGYVEVIGTNVASYARDEWGKVDRYYGEMTQAQASVTVRHPKGTGSGWAGQSSFDFGRLDVPAMAKRAFDKCVQSIDAVRVEPGRYTVILEPQAAHSFFNVLLRTLNRSPQEAGSGHYTLGYDALIDRHRTKLGMRIVDERITMFHDPEHTLTGTMAEPGLEAITYINNGVLSALTTSYSYALNELLETSHIPPRGSYYVAGGDTSMEEMIESTSRGFLLTRVSVPSVVDHQSLLTTGVTRDGLWLIENGRITKAVRNFRFTESPLFMLNNLEQIGETVPVFSPVTHRRAILHSRGSGITPVVVPPIKVRDFSFTSTVDAI